MIDTEPLIAIIAHSLKLQPRQEIADLVKLVYQNEFGAGHMVSDEKASLERIKEEIHTGLHDPEPSFGRFMPLGNGLCRLHLAGIDKTGLTPETLNRLFVTSANQVQGEARRFKDKLLLLRGLLEEMSRQRDLTSLDEFMEQYDFSTCPPISHSPLYRRHYLPRYRVVMLDAWLYLELFARIDQLLSRDMPVILGLDGPCGSGKSTLADLLHTVYGGALISMDHFFLPPEKRTVGRLQEPGGNVDYERFLNEVAEPLVQGRPFSYHVFNCQTMTQDRQIDIKPGRLTIVEGSYSLHPHLRHLYNLKVFLTVDRPQQIHRIKQRNDNGQVRDFLDKWIPLEDLYFDRLMIALHSDLVLRGEREDLIAQWLQDPQESKE